MGSSKKHKDDKERKHKHRHKGHEKSRSRSKDRPRREDREKRDDREKRVDREKRDDRSKQDTSSAMNNASEGSKRSYQADSGSAVVELNKSVDTKPGSSDSVGAGLVLSVSESNKLRAKLGLRPLEEAGAKREDGSTVDGDNDVHAPPTNMADVRKSEELREKLLQAKEKRRVNMLLGKVKHLADDDDDEDSAVAWVKRSRKIDADKERDKEMDAAFGIKSLVAEEFTAARPKYGSEDLRGLRVEHAQDGFADERTTILVLKDRGILEEGDTDDTLINVNMVDDERATKNNEVKKKKPDYKPYDEPELDEYGIMKPRDILDKYNEEIDGVQKESFQLGRGGRYDAEHERRMYEIKSTLRQQGEVLTLPPPKIASEYYTNEEMSSFKKRKKKVRSTRTRVALTAEELFKMSGQAEGQDHGSRRPKVKVQDEQAAVELDADYGPDSIMEDMDLDDQDEDASGESGPAEDLTGCGINEDIASRELEQSLNKARRIKDVKSHVTERSVRIKTEDDEEVESEERNPLSSIVLYSTSEFCRSLGDIPTYGQAGNRDDMEDEKMETMDINEQDLANSSKVDMDDDEQGAGGAWQSVEIDSRPVEIKAEDKPALDDEPVLNGGLAGALRLARTKGYLDAQEKTYKSHHPEMEAKNFSIEDKRYDDLDEKYNRKRDRYSGGATMDFKDKDNYKPIIKLEYVDEHGRTIPPKEAFRALSHRFHGKGSGKKKTEKRMKKVEEAELMKFMSSTDTPLNTVHLLKEKQKLDRMPYVILSGGKGIGANNIAK